MNAAGIDRHSINCYFCHALVDERECMPADPYNDEDGGNVCPDCLANLHKSIAEVNKIEEDNN